MAQYISKAVVVEARQYDGGPLVIVHDDLGELKAVKGDWLLGTERGKVFVVSDEKFKEKYIPYSATPTDDALKSEQAKSADLQKQLDAANASLKAANDAGDTLVAENAKLNGQVGDTNALAAQVSDLKAKLATAQAQATADEKMLSDLTANLKAQKEAQAAIDASQASLDKAVGA